MTRDWSIRKRRPVRRKNIAPLLKDLEEALDIDLSVDGAFLEMAEYGPWQMVLVDKVAIGVEVTNDEGEPPYDKKFALEYLMFEVAK